MKDNNDVVTFESNEIEKFSKDMTLAVFRIGCDQKNFRILQMLPTHINSIMEELRITKMPANSRVNSLVRVGLASRQIGTGLVEPTELTSKFLELIMRILEDVERNVPMFLERLGL